MKSSAIFASFFALSLAMAILIYAGSLSGEFVYDDIPFVAENRYIRSIWNFPYFFLAKESASEEAHSIYRPLRTFSYAIDHLFWGKNAFGYRLTNIFLHAANALIIFIIFSSILKNLAISLLTSLIFLTHPVNSEAVAWISSRGDLLAAFFSLASLAIYIRGGRENRPDPGTRNSPRGGLGSFSFALSLVFFAAALLSKESALALPLALVAYDFSLGKASTWAAGMRGSPKLTAAVRLFIFRHGPFFALGALYIALRYSILGEIAQRSPGGQYLNTMLTVPAVFAHYFKLLFFPTDLRLIYAFKLADSVADLRFIVSSLILALSLVLIALAYRRSKYLFFSLAWLYAWLLPVSNIVPLKGLIQEHFLYIPSIGLFIALGHSMGNLRRRERTGLALFAFIILFYSALTAHRSPVWANGKALWSDTATKSPTSVLARNNLGAALLSRKEADKAFLQFRAALTLMPGYGQAWYNSALTLSTRSYLDRSFREYGESILAEGQGWLALTGLGVSYSKLGLKDRAIERFQVALSTKPYLAQALYNLSVELGLKGEFRAGANGFLRLLELEPENGSAAYNLGSIYQRLGRLDKAAHIYKRSLASGFGPFDMRNNYAALLANKGLGDEAIAEFKSVLLAEPGSAAARNNLAIALASKGAMGAALEEFQRAITIRPAYAEARENFAVALARAGRPREALTQYLMLDERHRPRAETREVVGDLYLQLGQGQKALAAYKSALEIANRASPRAEILMGKIAALSPPP